MEKRLRDYSEFQLRGAFSELGLEEKDIDRAVGDYRAYRERELDSIIGPSSIQKFDPEALANEMMNNSLDGVELVNRLLDHYLRYANHKRAIEKAYQESRDWGTVMSTVVYNDVYETQEAFVDYVEEIYQVRIENARQLQELTDITGLLSTWINGKRVEATTEEQAEYFATIELEETLTMARYSKYSRALKNTLQNGGSYNDLLQIKPTGFGLPETWKGVLATDQYSSILWAIEEVFQIGETKYIRPDLRTVAREIKAPYSVLLDVHKKCNFLTN